MPDIILFFEIFFMCIFVALYSINKLALKDELPTVGLERWDKVVFDTILHLSISLKSILLFVF